MAAGWDVLGGLKSARVMCVHACVCMPVCASCTCDVCACLCVAAASHARGHRAGGGHVGPRACVCKTAAPPAHLQRQVGTWAVHPAAHHCQLALIGHACSKGVGIGLGLG